eukprot:6227293-Pyramimonas_sp.AAC.1
MAAAAPKKGPGTQPAPGKTTTQGSSSHRIAPRRTCWAGTPGGSASDAGSPQWKRKASPRPLPRTTAAQRGPCPRDCRTTRAPCRACGQTG